MLNFLENEKKFMIEFYIKSLGEFTTTNKILDFHPFISRRTLYRHIKNEKFDYHYRYGRTIINTKSFAEFLFEI